MITASSGAVSFNETAYAQHGPIYMGTQNVWSTWASYASYISAFTWIATFGYTNIKDAVVKIQERRKAGNVQSINHRYGDRLNIIQRSYKEVCDMSRIFEQSG